MTAPFQILNATTIPSPRLPLFGLIELLERAAAEVRRPTFSEGSTRTKMKRGADGVLRPVWWDHVADVQLRLLAIDIEAVEYAPAWSIGGAAIEGYRVEHRLTFEPLT